MKTGLWILGFALVAAGLLLAGQGAGVVRWPRESFMLDQPNWIVRGILLVLIGLGLIFTARRRR